MSAHLRLAVGIEPIGVSMGNLASLWSQLTTGGPPLDECAEVMFTPEQGGTIAALFIDEHSVVVWAAYLGLAFAQPERLGPNSVRLIATGHITRGTRSAFVQLRCPITDRSAS